MGSGTSAEAISAGSTSEGGPNYRHLAALVRRGEWTTYGDLSIAAHGTIRFARHVARAATRGELPHAARVLAAGGRIAPGWLDDAGGGPEVCRGILTREGVTFVRDRADPRRYVPWERLIARADAAGLARSTTIGD